MVTKYYYGGLLFKKINLFNWVDKHCLLVQRKKDTILSSYWIIVENLATIPLIL